MKKTLNFTSDYINIKCDDINVEKILKEGKSIILYGVNGSGKTTLAKHLLKNNQDDFFYFNYEKSLDNKLVSDENKIYISKNIKIISELQEENLNLDIQIKKQINDLILKNLNITTKSEINSNLLKKNKKRQFFNDTFITNKKESDLNKINIDNIILNDQFNFKNDDESKEIDLKFLQNFFEKYKNINLESANIFIKKILDVIEMIIKNFSEFEKNVKKILSKHINIDYKIEIYEIIENINQLEKCLICNTYIENWSELKQSIKEEIDKYKNDLKTNETINNFKYLIAALNENDLLDIKKIFLNEIGEHISFQIINNRIENLKIDDFNSIKKFFLSFESEINNSILYIENYIFYNILNNKKDEKKLISKYKENLNLLKKLEKDKDLNIKIKNEFSLFLKFIEEKIGKNRIKFTENNRIEIDNSEEEIENSENLSKLKKLSEGEINFVIFCFSMIYFILENDEKIIIIDDPFSSYDTGNELNIIYIVSHFINSEKTKFIIFSHNWNFLSCMYNNKILTNQPIYLYFQNDTYSKGKKFNILKFENIFNEQISSIINKNKKSNLDICFNNSNFVYLLKKMYEECFISWTDDEEKCFFLFSIIPLIRSYLYTYESSKENIELFSKMMHFVNNEKNLKTINFKKIENCYKFFLKNKNEPDENNLINLLEKIIRNEYFENLINNRKSFLSNEFYKKNPLTKIALLLAIRKKIEFEISSISKNYNEITDDLTLLNKINYLQEKGKINTLDSMILKSKRLIFNTFAHFERLNNYILPLMEIDIDYILKNYDEIEKIINKIKDKKDKKDE